jgi:hypothetical protein
MIAHRVVSNVLLSDCRDQTPVRACNFCSNAAATVSTTGSAALILTHPFRYQIVSSITVQAFA